MVAQAHEQDGDQVMEIHRPVVNDFGGAPFAEHDQACAVCGVEKAVLELHTGHFLPCWVCQQDGWKLTKKKGIFRR